MGISSSSRQDCIRPVNKWASALLVDGSRTLRPHRPNQIEPALRFFAELSRARIVGTSQLADEAEIAEKWNAFPPPSGETTIREPHEQIESRWTGRKCLGRLQIGWYRVIENLTIELVAQNDRILAIAWK